LLAAADGCWWLRYLVTRLFFFLILSAAAMLNECRTNEDAIGIFFFFKKSFLLFFNFPFLYYMQPGD
jgi:hypothetical protein